MLVPDDNHVTRYKARVEYDGTEYAGWQAQAHGNTITDMLCGAYKRAFKESISIVGASRTDAGVHSLGQVMAFSTRLILPEEKLEYIWNKNLPSAISVRTIEKKHQTFSPRAHVVQKTYLYHFFVQRPSPLHHRFGYILTKKINIDYLEDILKIFEGTHNFGSFSTDTAPENAVKTIDSITLAFNKELNAYQIIVKGKSFLHHMIRRVVGAALQVALGQKDREKIYHALFYPRSEQEFFNAPACGLILNTITYQEEGYDR